MSDRKSGWTDEEYGILRDLYPEKGPLGVVKAMRDRGYNRSIDSVRSKASNLGLRCRATTSWTDEEERILRETYPSLGTKGAMRALAKAGYHRSSSAVRMRASTLEIRSDRRLYDGRAVFLSLCMDSVSDADVLDFMRDNVRNRSEYFRALVRDDIARGGVVAKA